MLPIERRTLLVLVAEITNIGRLRVPITQEIKMLLATGPLVNSPRPTVART